MKGRLYVYLASSSFATLCTLFLLRRRARKRANAVADRAMRHVADGILLDTNDERLRERILRSAIKRASKWMSFQSDKPPIAMIGQVGGHGRNKAPILSMEPDYILKPVHTKEYRGLREIAFYESLELASHHQTAARAAQVLFESTESDDVVSPTLSSRFFELVDFVAMTLAFLLRDPVVADSEAKLLASWKVMEEEIEVLQRLSLFTASYYGVVENIPQQPLPPHGAHDEPTSRPQYHILLQDVTSSFRRPCVMDLKVGTQTFEPDASWKKKEKERKKYGECQGKFGFRLVGMRKYEPNHPNADLHGYVTWDKLHGRSLTTMEALIESFATFFRANHYGSLNDHEVISAKVRVKVVASVLSLVRALLHRFKDNQRFVFYSSSVLIVYDAMDDTDHANLRMVDFGHVRRQAGGDVGYQHGLHTLSSILMELLQMEPSSSASSPLRNEESPSNCSNAERV